MSMACKGCYAYVAVIMHDLEDFLVVVEQAGIVAGLWMDGQMAENNRPLALLLASAKLLSQPLQLFLTHTPSKLYKTPFRLGHPGRACRVILVLQAV